MYCFWSGEKELGAIDGVVDVASGFVGYHEVVKVKYDPNKISSNALTSRAKAYNFKQVEKNGFKASSRDLHYYLQNSPYKYLPLTTVQQVKINSALGNGKSPLKYLSPIQRQWFNKHTATQKVLFNIKFEDAWHEKASEVSGS